MAKGKILIVDKTNGSVFGWFGETEDDSRTNLENIMLLELEPEQYKHEFINIKSVNDIKVIDIENKVLEFNITSAEEPTYEDLQLMIEMMKEGII